MVGEGQHGGDRPSALPAPSGVMCLDLDVARIENCMRGLWHACAEAVAGHPAPLHSGFGEQGRRGVWRGGPGGGSGATRHIRLEGTEDADRVQLAR